MRAADKSRDVTMELYDKVIVITGSTSGLGKALAQQLVHEGAKIVINGRKKEEVDRVAQELGATPFAADVTDERQVRAIAVYTEECFGRIDVWINNAGIWTPHAPFEEQESLRIRAMIEVNFFGTFYGARAAFIQMKKQHTGTIMNILSTSALQGRARSAGYCASKYAADGLTKSLRLAAESEGINVLAVYPDGMKTPIFHEAKE